MRVAPRVADTRERGIGNGRLRAAEEVCTYPAYDGETFRRISLSSYYEKYPRWAHPLEAEDSPLRDRVLFEVERYVEWDPSTHQLKGPRYSMRLVLFAGPFGLNACFGGPPSRNRFVARAATLPRFEQAPRSTRFFSVASNVAVDWAELRSEFSPRCVRWAIFIESVTLCDDLRSITDDLIPFVSAVLKSLHLREDWNCVLREVAAVARAADQRLRFQVRT